MKTILMLLLMLPLISFSRASGAGTPETFYALATLTKVGQEAPAFSVTTLDGKTLDSKHLKGRVVLLDFFATWCGPCLMEMPHLEKEIWQRFNDKGLVVIAIGRAHQNKDLIDFQKKKGFTFPIAGDPKREVYGKFAKQYIPRNVLIGKDGKIIFQSVGFEEPEFQKMVQAIEKAL